MSEENKIEAKKLSPTTDFLPSDGSSCSASSELLGNLESWADEFRSNQHGATLSILRAIRRIKDLERDVKEARGVAEIYRTIDARENRKNKLLTAMPWESRSLSNKQL